MEESRKSKLAKKWSRRALKDYSRVSGLYFAETPETGHFQKLADYDAVMMKKVKHGLEISGILEQKTRWFSEKKLESWGYDALIEMDKIRRCQAVATATRVPLFLMITSVTLRAYWVIKANIENIRTEIKEVQQSTEGGVKAKEVGYFKLKNEDKHELKNI